jgi:arylsulfatase A-like enzyme
MKQWAARSASLLLGAAWVLLNGSCLIPGKPKPNIVLIIIDTLRADKLGCYGSSVEASPEIDELAREGLVFEKVIAQSSWTRPSVGSMLTSLYPRTLGIYKEEWDVLPDEYLTLSEILQQSGYHTIGMTANPNINRTFNFHQGFDDYSDSSVIFPWMKNEAGKKKASPELDNLLRSETLFQAAIKKAESSPDLPVYLQILVMEVHTPALTRAEFRGSFTDIAHADYFSAVRQMSHDVGRFVRRLRALPGWENTLFVITSDHGEGLSDHPEVPGSMTHGNMLYGSVVEVPLIIYYPGHAPSGFRNRRVAEKVRLLDLMPTLLEYVRISAPDEIDGMALQDLVRGKPLPLPTQFVTETNWKIVDKIAVYSDEWKYFENRDDWPGVNPQELQSTQTRENGVRTDSINEHGDVARALKRYLDVWEKLYPKADSSTTPRKRPTKEEIEQLKSLGYIK